MLRGIEGQGVRWAMSQYVIVSSIDTTHGIVEFEGPAGNVSLSVKSCQFFYQDYREAPPDMREAAKAETVSALSIFFLLEEAFLFYELRERQSLH
jgi:hypothetical protein